ncbi:pentapeptide repeat-containing protein [Pseudovibrio flavus]|uniref:pentapeptide repeat-containing protein n=1 Tax=Pseudovibrio flavus TaxID=2529854 RepID=UPI00211BD142|nr:pentapeptide repeat-containing protein [Pseudovibrio flavus]
MDMSSIPCYAFSLFALHYRRLPNPMQRLNQDQFRRYIKHEEVLMGFDLTGIDFSEAALDGARFKKCFVGERGSLTEADLSDTLWEDCIFTGTSFRSCELNDAQFKNCRFYDPSQKAGSSFWNCELNSSQFTNCDLQLSQFEGSSLYGAVFSDCMMRGSSFVDCEFSRRFSRGVLKSHIAFKECDLAYASLTELVLPFAVFKGTNLSGADLSRSDLSGTNFSACNLNSAELQDADLTKANLKGAKLLGLDLRRLKGYRGMTVSADQQHHLLMAMGLDISGD